MWPTAAARSGFSRIATQMRPTGEATIRRASDDADEIADREKTIHRPAAGHMDRREAEIERRPGHARQAVLAAGKVDDSGEFSMKKNTSAIATVIMAK